MSEVMRTGIIRMPYDMAMQSELSRRQFYDRAQSLLTELEEAEQTIQDQSMIIKDALETIEAMLKANKKLADHLDVDDANVRDQREDK